MPVRTSFIWTRKVDRGFGICMREWDGVVVGRWCIYTNKNEFLFNYSCTLVLVCVNLCLVICVVKCAVIPVAMCVVMWEWQGSEDSQDALSCRLFSAKEPLILGLFYGKRPVKIRHFMGLRHPIRCNAMMHVWPVLVCIHHICVRYHVVDVSHIYALGVRTSVTHCILLCIHR